MPEKEHSIKNIDVRKAKVQTVIEGEGGHRPVSDVDEQEARIKGTGFRINWDGEEMVADKAARELYDKFQADPDSFELKESEGEKEIVHKETGESAKFTSEVVFGPAAAKIEESEEAPPSKEGEEEVTYLPEDQFLKAHGLYGQFLKTMDDVDRDIEHHRQRLQNHDGYVGNEILFSPESTATPEAKVETLKALRSASAFAVKNYREAARLQPEGKPPEKKKPTSPQERLSEDELEALGDPASEGFIKALDKYADLKAEERVKPLQARLDRLEWEQSSEREQLKKEDAESIIRQRPYLRSILSSPNVPMNEKADLLATLHRGSIPEEEREALYNAGRVDQIRLQTKRNAQVRLAPSRPAQRTVTPTSNQKVKEAMAKIAELRKARKSGSATRVAPEIRKVLEQLG